MSAQHNPESSPHDATTAWYEEAFQQEYLDIYLHRDLAEAARAVRFLARALELDGHQRLLDLCCGPGRHLTFLKERAACAVGLDLSWPLLRRAQMHGREVHGESMPIAEPLLVRADMGRLPLADAAFDRVVNLFTSFGYFEEEARNQYVLDEVARVLRPGGRFAIDHINRDEMLAGLRPHSERRLASGTEVIEDRRWDAAAGRVIKCVTLIPTEGPPKHWHESVRVYEPDELEAMIRRAGLEPEARHGDYDGSPWRADAPRLLILARRKA